MGHPISIADRAERLGIDVADFAELRAVSIKLGKPNAGSIQEAAPNAKLFDLKQTARKLGISEDQVRGFVKAGELRFINLGLGKKRPRMRFTQTDLDDFIERRGQRIVQCLSIDRRSHLTGSMTSRPGATGFTARRNAQLAKTPKSLKQ